MKKTHNKNQSKFITKASFTPKEFTPKLKFQKKNEIKEVNTDVSAKTSGAGLVRLQKYIADSGICSRRKAEDLILEGKVKVNGNISRILGTKVNKNSDVIEVNDNVIDPNSIDQLYIVLNKPRGYLTTVNDPEGRKTVMDLMGKIPTRLFPVGRLDYLSEGLLIMTNDGEFSNRVIHPSSEVEKVYEVKIFGVIDNGTLAKLKKGVDTEIGFLKPKSVRVLKILPGKTWLEFRLMEGKNREIRRICESFDLIIDKLKRVSIGGLSIEGIGVGNFVIYSKYEIEKLIGIGKYKKSKKTENVIQYDYVSPKKSINKNKIEKYKGVSVNDPKFSRFKSQEYKEFMNLEREKKKIVPKKNNSIDSSALES